MYKTALYIIIIILNISLFSCKSRKDMVYIQNSTDQEELEVKATSINSYQIKVNDNLFVDIQTLDPKVNALFNPTKLSGTSGGTAQNFGNISSQMLNGFQVDIRGEISLPIIGNIKVENLTLDESQQAIQEKANEYLKDAIVKIKLLTFKYTVLGEVNSPGVYYNYNNLFSILDAISEAKGETDYSKVKQVKVIRYINGKNKVFILDLSQSDFFKSEAYYIQPNDVIYVEPDKSKPFKINMPVYSLIFSSISALVLLVNFVNNN